MKSIYCPKCDKRVETEATATIASLIVRKKNVRARQLQAVCPHCGELIADEDISRANLEYAFAAYRAEEGLLSPEEIREAYAKYGLTQKSFGVLLNLGGATLSRYEHGALQTRQIDAAIRQAMQPKNMLALLDEHEGQIRASQAQSARQAAQAFIAAEASEETEMTEAAEASGVDDNAFTDDSIGNFRLALSDEEPNALNGFRRLNWERVTHMIVYMATHCANLGRTKLNKALFYSDFSCFADSSCSMSGLVYARAANGPVVDRYGTVFSEMVREGHLIEETVSCGPIDAIIFKTNESFDGTLFTSKELVILEKVAQFVNSFDTAGELSEYSHKEKLWMENDDGGYLSYLDAYGLNHLEQFIAG